MNSETQPPNKNGIEEFLRFATDFKDVSSIATKVVAVIPIAAAAVKIGPPFSLIPYFTAIAAFAVLVWAFQFWAAMPKERLDSRLRSSLIVTILSVFGYFALNQKFVDEPTAGPNKGMRVVIGTGLHPQLAGQVSKRVRAETERVTREQKERDSALRYNAEQTPIPRGTNGDDTYYEYNQVEVPDVEPAKSKVEIRSEVVAEALEKRDLSGVYSEGIAEVSIALFVLWAVLVSSWTAFIGIFVIAQRR